MAINAGATPTSTGPCGFFKLPLELRNQIYNEFACDIEKSNGITHIRFENYVSPIILLLNRQIKQEAEKELMRMTTTHIRMEWTVIPVDTRKILYSSPRIKSGLARLIRKASVKLVVVGDCASTDVIADALRWMANFSGKADKFFHYFPATKTIDLTLAIKGDLFDLFVTKGDMPGLREFCEDRSRTHHTLQVSRILHLTYKLLQAHPARGEFIAAMIVEDSEENRITYAATPAATGTAWHGFDLSTIPRTASTYDDLVQKAEIKLNYYTRMLFGALLSDPIVARNGEASNNVEGDTSGGPAVGGADGEREDEGEGVFAGLIESLRLDGSPG